MIQMQASAARIAGARMTTQRLKVLSDSVEQASCLLARSQRERKAAAHAEIFNLLADLVDDRGQAPVLRDGAGCLHDLMLAAGRAADEMIARSRQRLLTHIRAGHGDGAALEMEDHLRDLHLMWRRAAAATAVARSEGPPGRGIAGSSSPWLVRNDGGGGADGGSLGTTGKDEPVVADLLQRAIAAGSAASSGRSSARRNSDGRPRLRPDCARPRCRVSIIRHHGLHDASADESHGSGMEGP